ncbi:MAG: anti-sigma factor [Phycisphaerales bacterium]|nr:anti-sigma factor [Phycisphaerales bacterium]
MNLRRRCLELLAGRTDLTDDERMELARLQPSASEEEAIRRAEAMLRTHLASESLMPPHVRQRVRARLARHDRVIPIGMALGWGIAALLAIGLGLSIMFRPAPAVTRPPTIEAQRQSLLTSDAVRRAGDLMADEAFAGSVEWYPEEQTGFLSIADLPDARGERTYQAWLVDEEGRVILAATFEHVRMVEFGKPVEHLVPLAPAMPVRSPGRLIVSIEAVPGRLAPTRPVAEASLR